MRAESAGSEGDLSTRIFHTLIMFAASVIITAILASIVQTQVNLGALIALGAPMPVATRWQVTIEDVARFGPIMAAIVAAAFLPAFTVAHVAARRFPPAWRATVFAVAGVFGLWTAFFIMGFVTPMPALVAATRGTTGLALICATGAVGGLTFARLTRTTPCKAVGRPCMAAALLAALIAIPAGSFALMRPPASAPVDRVDPQSFTVGTVATGLDRPWAVAILPDGRRLVSEMSGRLRVFGADGAASLIATDALRRLLHKDDPRLMDVVPDSDFASTGLLFLTMTYGDDRANGTRLVRARLSGNRLTEVRRLFDSTPKTSNSNDGSRIALLPDDTLLMTLGDANDRREEAQNPANSFGKLIRLDRDGRPPASNPYATRPGWAPAVYSIGHRNVQGVAVDPANGAVLISDHGPRGGDEIGEIRPGGNHGWPIVTGGIDYSFARVTPFRRLAGYDDPMLEWTPSIAPAGLAVYRGRMFPDWQGALLVPALKERSVRLVERRNGRIVRQRLLLAERNERIRDVRVASDGSIYVLTDGEGASLLRLTSRTQVLPTATRRETAL